MAGIREVVVVGGGPAGLTAARVAAEAGADVLVLERAAYPRYKTCGGGLTGTSLAALPVGLALPTLDRVNTIEATLRGRHLFRRKAPGAGVLTMVCRADFDTALRDAAVAAGAEVRERCTVRGLYDNGGTVTLRMADGTSVRARTVVGADGTAGVTARWVGVVFDHVDLGLELELPITGDLIAQWRHRVLLDWGPLPGSYGWVFPKHDSLTVGVIAARGGGEQTRAYLADFVARLGLSGIEPLEDSGHLTRCRTADSPLRRGRVIVAGDAAGLLEPWTREGISFALRSGAMAGAAAASGDLDGYAADVRSNLEPEMEAGKRLRRAFALRPSAFHWALATPPGWAWFARFCRGETTFARALRHRSLRVALSLLG